MFPSGAEQSSEITSPRHLSRLSFTSHLHHDATRRGVEEAALGRVCRDAAWMRAAALAWAVKRRVWCRQLSICVMMTVRVSIRLRLKTVQAVCEA